MNKTINTCRIKYEGGNKYMFRELVIGSKNPTKVERFQKLLKHLTGKDIWLI